VDEIIALPTRFMGPDDYEYAVAFALPADWEGIRICSLPAQHHKRNHIDAPCAHVGDAESLTIFDDVFVPNDRIFMNGKADPRQTPYAGLLALMFAHFHRHSYTGCKPAVSEVLASEAALIAEYNGIEKASHVKDKLCHIIGVSELVFAAGEASAYRAVPTDSGTWLPDEILTNAGRKLAGEEIFNEYKILADLSGGLIATLPMEGDFYNEEVGELLHKYIARNPKVSTENVHRAFRMIENQMVSSFGASQMVAGLHGGGSPQMETIAMMQRYDLENLKRLAKYLAGFDIEVPRIERPTITPMKMLEKFEKYTDKAKAGV
jgi:4-hydroxyphenylacetate 3-monooxygenase/4-hydroxybutyryl-CoA dehydratase/vinylacetyl-CoA-Delta-isomerase